MARDALSLMSFAVLCAVFVNSALAKNITDYKDCGSKGATIVRLDISPCEEEPCNFKTGTTVTGTLTFVAKEYFTSGRVKAYAVIEGVDLPLPIPTDACQGYGLTCPINNGQTANFVIKQEIQADFPKVKLQLKGEALKGYWSHMT
ncbi:Epididymal secretory protein E1 [Exaiptasia diaphana]|nr:Epididymal secretory protein E1 [Exaiptasia diaphana]